MKHIRILFLPVFVLFAQLANAQQVDLQGVSIDASANPISVNQTATLDAIVKNNGPGAIPAGQAIVTVSINSTFLNFITPLALTDASGLWTITASSASSVTLSNTNGALPGNPAVGYTLSVGIKGVANGTSSLNLASSLSLDATVSDRDGTNQSAAGSTLVESPTPVTIASFTAKAVGTNAQLDWVTSSERNNAFFDIQHSTDLKVFESVGKIAGKGTTSARNTYTFTHFNPDPAVIHYYRLRQVDNDGTYADQPVKSVQFDSYVGIALKAHADPGRNVRVFVDYGDDNLSSAATVSLLDVTGQKVGTRSIQLVKGRNTVDFASGSLASGVYLVRLENPSKNTSVRIVLP